MRTKKTVTQKAVAKRRAKAAKRRASTRVKPKQQWSRPPDDQVYAECVRTYPDALVCVRQVDAPDHSHTLRILDTPTLQRVRSHVRDRMWRGGRATFEWIVYNHNVPRLAGGQWSLDAEKEQESPTMRDHFAATAMMALVNRGEDGPEMSASAYDLADQLLAERALRAR